MKKLFCAVALIFSVQSYGQALDWSDLELGQSYILASDLVFDNGVTVKSGEKYTMTDMLPGTAGFPYIFMEFVDRNCAEPGLEAEYGVLLMKDSREREYKVLIKMEANCHVGMYVHGSKYYDLANFK